MLETSAQARFMIPMAISIAYGVMFASFITLFLVPASYLILDDLGRLAERLHLSTGRSPSSAADVGSRPAEGSS